MHVNKWWPTVKRLNLTWSMWPRVIIWNSSVRCLVDFTNCSDLHPCLIPGRFQKLSNIPILDCVYGKIFVSWLKSVFMSPDTANSVWWIHWVGELVVLCGSIFILLGQSFCWEMTTPLCCWEGKTTVHFRI